MKVVDREEEGEPQMAISLHVVNEHELKSQFAPVLARNHIHHLRLVADRIEPKK